MSWLVLLGDSLGQTCQDTLHPKLDVFNYKKKYTAEIVVVWAYLADTLPENLSGGQVGPSEERDGL